MVRRKGLVPLLSERATKVIVYAKDEAVRLNHPCICTEHLLLGFIREGEGVGIAVLNKLGVDPKAVRVVVSSLVRPGATTGDVKDKLPFTPGAKKALELAVEEARAMGHDYVGTVHLLLGMCREAEGVAAGVLGNFGITMEKLRLEAREILRSAPSDAVE